MNFKVRLRSNGQLTLAPVDCGASISFPIVVSKKVLTRHANEFVAAIGQCPTSDCPELTVMDLIQ